MTRIFFVITALLVIGLAPAKAEIEAGPLVTPIWLHNNMDQQDLVILDVRGRNAHSSGHIPGSVPTDYGADGWRIKTGNVPAMLPPSGHMESLIGGLGISNANHVVIVPHGASATEMGVATRIYWTFKVMGHQGVSILDGGFRGWAADKNRQIATGAAQVAVATFEAKMDESILATVDDVMAVVDTKNAGIALIDHRPQGQFLGINKSGVAQRYGTVPGARNAPAMWATVNDGGSFRSAEELNAIYAAAGIPSEGSIISFCNTGHWASVGWFVSHEILGNKQAKMYDGSMAEWSRNTSRPMQTLVPKK